LSILIEAGFFVNKPAVSEGADEPKYCKFPPVSLSYVNMNMMLFQKKLCNTLQNGLPIVARPFAHIAEQLGCDEAAAIAETKNLIAIGVIRRISAAINYRILGRVSALVAGHVEEQKLDSVVAAVNRLEGVSHNYLRDHFYNLWFTLQSDSESRAASILAGLCADAAAMFHWLPAIRTFKLDVRFDAESEGMSLLPCEDMPVTTVNPEDAVVCLSDEEKTIVAKLQQNLEIVPEPFDSEEIRIIQNLIGNGVIRRIAAVVNYRELGFFANAMFVCVVEDQRVEEVGRRLAASNNVSHCYQRKTFSGWPYTLFGMMHGKSMGQLEQVAAKFCSQEKITQSALLKTVREFKKKPVRI
jgi:siroheme decarboxylase